MQPLIFNLDSPLGVIQIHLTQNNAELYLLKIEFVEPKNDDTNNHGAINKDNLNSDNVKRDNINYDDINNIGLINSNLLNQITEQLNAYFTDPNFRFNLNSLNLKSQGTEFQRKVWQALTEIPLGEVLTYGQLAKQLDTSPRAVGNACRKNPIPLLIPCHRIVSATGLGGFAGETQGRLTQIKTWLLKHEGVEF